MVVSSGTPAPEGGKIQERKLKESHTRSALSNTQLRDQYDKNVLFGCEDNLVTHALNTLQAAAQVADIFFQLCHTAKKERWLLHTEGRETEAASS